MILIGYGLLLLDFDRLYGLLLLDFDRLYGLLLLEFDRLYVFLLLDFDWLPFCQLYLLHKKFQHDKNKT